MGWGSSVYAHKSQATFEVKCWRVGDFVQPYFLRQNYLKMMLIGKKQLTSNLDVIISKKVHLVALALGVGQRQASQVVPIVRRRRIASLLYESLSCFCNGITFMFTKLLISDFCGA